MKQKKSGLLFNIVLTMIGLIGIIIIVLIYKLITVKTEEKAPTEIVTTAPIEKKKISTYLDKLEQYKIKTNTKVSQEGPEKQDTASLVAQTSEEGKNSVSSLIDAIVTKSLTKSNMTPNLNETEKSSNNPQ